MKEVRVFIADIWESIEKIEDYAAGVTFADFSKNSALQDAVIRRLEIIGEAVKLHGLTPVASCFFACGEKLAGCSGIRQSFWILRLGSGYPPFAHSSTALRPWLSATAGKEYSAGVAGETF